MKRFAKGTGYIAIGLVAAGIVAILPENWRLGVAVVGGIFFASHLITTAVREALMQARFEELRQLYTDTSETREQVERMARQVDYLTQIISQLDRR